MPRQRRQHGRLGATAASLIAASLPLAGGAEAAADEPYGQADGSHRAQVVTDAAVHPVKEGATARVRVSVATTGSGPLDEPVTVAYTTEGGGGTATSGQDYRPVE